MHSILKSVFLEIQNKAIRPVLSGPVTYYFKAKYLMAIGFKILTGSIEDDGITSGSIGGWYAYIHSYAWCRCTCTIGQIVIFKKA